MCPHNRFEVVYYENAVMVRKCKDCGKIQVKIEYWIQRQELGYALEQLNKMGIDLQD